MDKDQLIQRLMATFVPELEEHVLTFNRALMALEKAPAGKDNTELLNTLLRTMHTLKGAARSVSVSQLEVGAHRIEEILAAVRDGNLQLDPALLQLLFSAVDAIEEVGHRLSEKQDLSGSQMDALLLRLEAARPRPVQKERPKAVVPAPAPPETTATPAEPSPLPAPAGPVVAVPAVSSRPAPVEGSGRRAPRGPPTGQGSGERPMRVSAEKLDALLVRSGELLGARRRAATRIEELAALEDFVAHWQHEWRHVEGGLRGMLRPQSERQAPDISTGNGLNRSRFSSRRALNALGRVKDNLRRLSRDLERLARALERDHFSLEQTAAQLEDEVRRVRMVPFAEACDGLERTARDLARASGKAVELVCEGSQVELDRSIVDGLKDPLLHLVRNAVDHGAELPAEREACGKPARALITVAAGLRASRVEITVADDGRGLDLEAIAEQARHRNLQLPENERELSSLIFKPGFTTSPSITELSGRGVGLDIVKSRLEALHGTVEVSSAPGQGTRFTLTVPLTLTTIRALLVSVGGQLFAIAATNVRLLLRVAPDELRSVQGQQMVKVDDSLVPLASLAQVLGQRAMEPVQPHVRVPVVLVAAGEKLLAFAVDQLIAEQEVVVKGLGARLKRVRNFAGGTLLPGGQIALILNAAELIRNATAPGTSTGVALAPAEGALKARKRILVADDSITTRTLESTLLEAAGYEVISAVDGAEAWQVLQERDVDLVVSDVDMPRMNGYSLAEAIRGSKRLRDLPVVLVTSLDSDKDRLRGIQAGANAYLGKSTFDQKNLLETIAQLL